jgi:hypothetical protein
MILLLLSLYENVISCDKANHTDAIKHLAFAMLDLMGNESAVAIQSDFQQKAFVDQLELLIKSAQLARSSSELNPIVEKEDNGGDDNNVLVGTGISIPSVNENSKNFPLMRATAASRIVELLKIQIYSDWMLFQHHFLSRVISFHQELKMVVHKSLMRFWNIVFGCVFVVQNVTEICSTTVHGMRENMEALISRIFGHPTS